MTRTEIKIGGFGGQGIILSGYIIGKAAAIYDKKNATLTQAYGPEARGGACSANVIISDDVVDYPKLIAPDILVAMSQEAYSKFFPQLKNDGYLIVEEDLVKTGTIEGNTKFYSIPASKMAEKIGRRIVANIIMLGFFTAVTGAVSFQAMKESILSSVPSGTLELNQKAFEAGYDYGLEKVKTKK
ncbi:MAG: 2-oxoacid:acceptor oxidoreductase family protein [Candidatus Altiarchaeota archaeon]